jgi:hypothetical protein
VRRKPDAVAIVFLQIEISDVSQEVSTVQGRGESVVNDSGGMRVLLQLGEGG